MSEPLKQAVRGYLENQQLDPHKLNELLALQQASLKPAKWYRKPMFRSVAAGIAVLGLATILWLAIPDQYTNINDAIVQEVIKNHIKAKPLEVESAQFSKVSAYFSELDFIPSLPSQNVQGLALQGARYCSILGESAAQVRYEAQTGTEMITVYQVDASARAFDEVNLMLDNNATLQTTTKGLDVTMWRENGLLYVKTSPVQSRAQ